MLRLLVWREEVSIGRGGEVSIERLLAEAIDVGSGTGRGDHGQAQEEEVVGLGDGRRGNELAWEAGQEHGRRQGRPLK